MEDIHKKAVDWAVALAWINSFEEGWRAIAGPKDRAAIATIRAALLIQMVADGTPTPTPIPKVDTNKGWGRG